GWSFARSARSSGCLPIGLDLIDVTHDPRRISGDHRPIRNVADHHRPGADERVPTDADAGDQRPIPPALPPALDPRPLHRGLGVRGERIPSIREDDVRADPGTLLEDTELRDEGIRVNPHAITDHHVMLDDAVRTDAHVVADLVRLTNQGAMAGLEPA